MTDIDTARALLEKQRAGFEGSKPEPLSARIDRLKRAEALLKENGDALAAEVSADFGHRSETQTWLTDIMPAISSIKHARSKLKGWAKPQKKSAGFPMGLLGGRAEVQYQPKGVVGILAPWNFPIGMVFTPLAGILAAGNRALAKPSEITPRCSDLMAELTAQYFAEEEFAIVTGGPDVAQQFSALAFDHLIFTGGTAIASHVMRAAADNLVPVTLELGGKSPVLVSRSADLDTMAERVAIGKMMNAGQICLAPDYLLVPQESEDAVVGKLTEKVAAMYPTLLDNDDYASVVSEKHFTRLGEMLDDAREKGGDIVTVNPAGEDFEGSNGRKMPLHIVRGATDDMRVMQEEIFGPILPVRSYGDIDGAIAEVNERPRPLALYWFGKDGGERERVIGGTHSGGVTVNDVIMHNAIEELPFGGVGPSGMGAYHGEAGFREFSHARAVYRQSRFDVAKIAGIKPPYGKAAARTLKMMVGKE